MSAVIMQHGVRGPWAVYVNGNFIDSFATHVEASKAAAQIDRAERRAFQQCGSTTSASCDPVCPECDGFGYVECEYIDDWAAVADTRPCPACNGSGEPS